MNPDNFIAFLKFLGEYDEILQTYLISSPIKKAIFLYHDIQSDFKNIIGKNLILNGIINEIKVSKFYSIIGGETILHNNEVCAFFYSIYWWG